MRGSSHLSVRALVVIGTILFSAPSPVKALGQEWEYHLDAYYTALDYTLHLTTAPIPYFEHSGELEIYKQLITHPMPRFLIFEASVNPLPLTGVYLKRQARSFYDSLDFGDDQNLVQSVTAGFEEPAALSIFLGNVIDFKQAKRKSYGDGKGYIGTLLSGGHYHIKDNDLIKDLWYEAEWKLKGERKKRDVKLQWSYRAGAKFHSHKEIADVLYVSFKRGRINYDHRGFSWLNNSGLMYTFNFSARDFNAIQHDLVVDKKFPVKGKKPVPSIMLGFVYRTDDKYTGSLKSDTREFQLLIQPNLEF